MIRPRCELCAEVVLYPVAAAFGRYTVIPFTLTKQIPV